LGNFTHYMEIDIHEGKILKELVQSITTVQKLAIKIGKHRNTVGNWFDLVKVDTENLILVGKGLRYDMTDKFPRLKKYDLATELHYFNEDPAKYLKDVKSVESLIKNKDQTLADAELEIKMLHDKIGDLQVIISDKNDLLKSKDEIIEMLRLETKTKSEVKTA